MFLALLRPKKTRAMKEAATLERGDMMSHREACWVVRNDAGSVVRGSYVNRQDSYEAKLFLSHILERKVKAY